MGNWSALNAPDFEHVCRPLESRNIHCMGFITTPSFCSWRSEYTKVNDHASLAKATAKESVAPNLYKIAEYAQATALL